MSCIHPLKYLTSSSSCYMPALTCQSLCFDRPHTESLHKLLSIEEIISIIKQSNEGLKFEFSVLCDEIESMVSKKIEQILREKQQVIEEIRKQYEEANYINLKKHDKILNIINNQRYDQLRCADVFQLQRKDKQPERLRRRMNQIYCEFKSRVKCIKKRKKNPILEAQKQIQQYREKHLKKYFLPLNPKTYETSLTSCTELENKFSPRSNAPNCIDLTDENINLQKKTSYSDLPQSSMSAPLILSNIHRSKWRRFCMREQISRLTEFRNLIFERNEKDFQNKKCQIENDLT